MQLSDAPKVGRGCETHDAFVDLSDARHLAEFTL